MKIGTCVSLSSMEGISEKLKLLSENHFDSFQPVSWNSSVWTDENAVTLKKLLTQYKITAFTFWCGREGLRIWDFYDREVQVRHRRTCREARAPKELSSARLCDPQRTSGTLSGQTP